MADRIGLIAIQMIFFAWLGLGLVAFVDVTARSVIASPETVVTTAVIAVVFGIQIARLAVSSIIETARGKQG